MYVLKAMDIEPKDTVGPLYFKQIGTWNILGNIRSHYYYYQSNGFRRGIFSIIAIPPCQEILTFYWQKNF